MKFKLFNKETKEVMMEIEAVASWDATIKALEVLGYEIYVQCEYREREII